MMAILLYGSGLGLLILGPIALLLVYLLWQFASWLIRLSRRHEGREPTSVAGRYLQRFYLLFFWVGEITVGCWLTHFGIETLLLGSIILTVWDYSRDGFDGLIILLLQGNIIFGLLALLGAGLIFRRLVSSLRRYERTQRPG